MQIFHLESGAGRIQCGLWEPATASPRAFLLLPGFWGDFRRPAYREVCRLLTEHGTVVAANLRGHGGSAGIFTFGKREQESVGPLFKYLKQRGIKSVTAAGFSMGGWIMASHLAQAPEDTFLTEHLVLCGVPSRLPRLFPRPWKRGFVLQLAKGGRGVVRANPFDLWPPRSLEPSLSRLSSIPTTVVHATGDWMVHHQHGERIFETLGGPRRFVMIRDRRGLHVEMLCLYHPEAITQAIVNIPLAEEETPR